MAALIGADFEGLIPHISIKPDPVKPRITVKNLAGDAGHQGDFIAFTGAEGTQPGAQIIIVNTHVHDPLHGPFRGHLPVFPHQNKGFVEFFDLFVA
jgi:hypothetical protein